MGIQSKTRIYQQIELKDVRDLTTGKWYKVEDFLKPTAPSELVTKDDDAFREDRTTILEFNSNDFELESGLDNGKVLIKAKATPPVDTDITFGGFKTNDIEVIPPLQAVKELGSDKVLLTYDPAKLPQLANPAAMYSLPLDEYVVASDGITPTTARLFLNLAQISDSRITLDRVQKSYSLQLNPDFTTYGFSIDLTVGGAMVNTGYIDVSLESAGNIVNDINGSPIITKVNFNSGDTIPSIRLSRIITTKGLQQDPEYNIIIRHTATKNLKFTDLYDGHSSILFQGITDDEQSSVATNTYAQITGTRPIGIKVDFDDATRLVLRDATGNIKRNKFAYGLDGLRIYCSQGEVDYVSTKSGLTLSAGNDITYFNAGSVVGGETVVAARGKTIEAFIQNTSPIGAYTLLTAYYTGTEVDLSNAKVITGDLNGTRQYEADWREGNSAFISEDASGTVNTTRLESVIPDDATGFAVLLVPLDPVTPQTTEILEFITGLKEGQEEVWLVKEKKL